METLTYIKCCAKGCNWSGEVELSEDNSYQCPKCNQQFYQKSYPASVIGIKQATTKELDGVDAACFFHENKPAVNSCSECGAYLCELCDIELSSAHFCSNCFKSYHKKSGVFVRDVVLYESLILLVAYFSLMIPIVGAFIAAFVIIASIVLLRKKRYPYKNRMGKVTLVFSIIIAFSSILIGIVTYSALFLKLFEQ